MCMYIHVHVHENVPNTTACTCIVCKNLHVDVTITSSRKSRLTRTVVQ